MAEGKRVVTSTVLEWVFWLSALGAAYGYAGYALVLRLLVVIVGRPAPPRPTPNGNTAATMLVPVHNERVTIEAKVANVRALRYPEGRLDVVFVCDGCSDGTAEYLRTQQDERIRILELTGRRGKAAALNAGLEHARNEIIVFSDASIMLASDAIQQIVRPFADPEIGCVSGEDMIVQAGGEGLYGRYELALRRLESQLHSIVGASGSFYAQRRALCEPFLPGLAPDFLSVLRTVRRGYRAVSEPSAAGSMSAISDPLAEFDRKVRTILRGISTLVNFADLLNPLKYGWFAFELFSHKLVRWLVPLFLALLLVTSALLAGGSAFYLTVFLLQILFYGLAAAALGDWHGVAEWLPARITLYFTAANVATAHAWWKFFSGTRQELWSPSRR
jgi:cellulose synthase/poly-beta-1,6-N-acetylglucosamine synthase-like glycosyltransferase